MSKYQIACRPGHRPSEHLFVVKSVINHYKSKKKGLIATSFDLKKFFDFENLEDVMNSLYRLNVKGKVYRLLFKMNENVNIKVKTPVGLTESEETGPIVSQGTVPAAIISSSNIAVGVEEAFKESDKEILYHDIPINALSYMDDIFRMADNANKAQFGNDRMEEMINMKFNVDKSSYVIIGNKKGKEKC